jgi:hypothetical protein
LSDRGCPELHGRRVAGRSLGPCRLDRLVAHSIGAGNFTAPQSIRVPGASWPLEAFFDRSLRTDVPRALLMPPPRGRSG